MGFIISVKTYNVNMFYKILNKKAARIAYSLSIHLVLAEGFEPPTPSM